MMTFKQKEVLDKLILNVQKKFPETQLVSVAELNGNSFWIQILLPDDDNRFYAAITVVAKHAMDALLDYGFDFQFVPVKESDPDYVAKGNDTLTMAGV